MSGVQTFTEKIIGSSDPVYCHLTLPIKKGPIVLYLTENLMSTPPMGSLVYSLPSQTQVVSTNLFRDEGTINGAQRISHSLAKRLQRPIIVGSSILKGDNIMVLKAIIDFVETKITYNG